MKKKIQNIIILLIIITTNGITYYLIDETKNTDKCEEIKCDLKECDYYKGLMPFSVNNYERQIEENTVIRYVGAIRSQEQVLTEAEKIFVEYYRQINLSQKPYLTFIDHENGAFLIMGTSPNNNPGGVAYVIISIFDGEILALWYDE